MCELPVEIWFMIFSQCDILSLVKTEQCCKYFKDVLKLFKYKENNSKYIRLFILKHAIKNKKYDMQIYCRYPKVQLLSNGNIFLKCLNIFEVNYIFFDNKKNKIKTLNDEDIYNFENFQLVKNYILSYDHNEYYERYVIIEKNNKIKYLKYDCLNFFRGYQGKISVEFTSNTSLDSSFLSSQIQNQISHLIFYSLIF